jgi:hypothetical protein
VRLAANELGEHQMDYRVVRFGDVPWERRTEDNWPPLVKRMVRDPDYDLAVNIIWYARGVVEPRHVHDATHATWVLVGSAEMGGKRIGPGDLIYGPSAVPHGPLSYEMGCLLFGTLKGVTLHSAVDDAHPVPRDEGMPAHLAVSGPQLWQPTATGDSHAGEVKLMVEDRARGYVARMVRWRASSRTPTKVHSGAHAALIVSGSAVVGGQTLGPWDLIYGAGDVARGGIEFPEDCTLFVNSIQQMPPSANT